MRILMQLCQVEANERRAAQRRSDDNPAIDEAAHQVAAMVEDGFGQGLVEAVDLLDADGTYLYTLAGDPR